MKNTLPPKRILGLISSPRTYGNCELFTKEIARHVDCEHTLRLIRLTSLHIEPCKGCYGCIMDKPCPCRDDMAFLLEEIANADAIILSSPVYYLGVNAAVKKILDRGFLFFPMIKDVYGKPCILLHFYGIKDRAGATAQALESFAAFLGLDVKAAVGIQAALPGEAVTKNIFLKKAKSLGHLLFSKKKQKRKGGCPFCGSEIVRIVKNGFICTVCHGSFKSDGKGSFTQIKPGGVMGSLEHLMDHKRWLAGMKNRFMAKRKELMKVMLTYKDDGQWVEPK